MAHQELPSDKTEKEINEYKKRRRKVFAKRLMESGGKIAGVGIVSTALILAMTIPFGIPTIPLGLAAAVGLAGYGVARAAEGGIRSLKRG